MECGGCSECYSDYGFGFNNAKFSDRTIQLDIITPYLPDDSQPDPVDPTHSPCKRTRLNTDDADCLQLSDDHEADKKDGNPSSPYNCSTETKTIHVNTLILARKSPFFYKLFSNGMVESNQQHVTLQIQKSEEDAFMEMLKFMYTNTLSDSTPFALLDVLLAADKYEVASCTKYCLHTLQNSPMTCESAMIYLDLPSAILLGDTVQLLKDSAKQFLVACFKDISKFENEMLSLSLFGIEAVLSRDDLQTISEDEIYDFVMKWALRHYKRPSERKEVLNTRLLRLIRFTFMSRCKLMEVLTCTDIDMEHRSKLVFDALSLETPHLPTTEQQRAYKLLPVKVIQVNSPKEECVVYFNLKREVCGSLLPYGEICTRHFVFGGQGYQLKVTKKTTFGLFLCKLEENWSAGVEVRFSTRKETSQEFALDYYHTLVPGQKDCGSSNLVGGSWDYFIGGNSTSFINGVLYIRAELKIMPGWA